MRSGTTLTRQDRFAPKPVKDARWLSMISESEFIWPTRVYWEDTDAGGVVYHARYLAFLERARTEWMRRAGYGQVQLQTQEGVVFAVCAMNIAFKMPARLDDLLHISVRVLDCKRVSTTIVQTIARQTDTLVTAHVRLAALAASTFRPCAIPANVLAAISTNRLLTESSNN